MSELGEPPTPADPLGPTSAVGPPTSAVGAGPPSDRLADRLESRPSAPPDRVVVRLLRELAAVDTAVYRAIAATPTPALDGPLRVVTSAADHSKLWLGASGVLFALGGRRGRRAAITGVAAIGVTSAVVNLPMKLAGRRRRPDADAAGVPAERRVQMPTSASFPSGHSASAAAFASAASAVAPALGAPLGVAAAAVGYTRIHSGVHYPGDVIGGVVVGASIGEAVAWAVGRVSARRRR